VSSGFEINDPYGTDEIAERISFLGDWFDFK